MLLDIEAILHSYLEPLVAVPVVGSTPKNTAQGWIQVTQRDARAVGNQHVDQFHAYAVQLDCYAATNGPAGQGEASSLYRQVRDALVVMSDAELVGADVKTVRFGACPRVPDTAFTPARQRIVIDAHIYAH